MSTSPKSHPFAHILDAATRTLSAQTETIYISVNFNGNVLFWQAHFLSWYVGEMFETHREGLSPNQYVVRVQVSRERRAVGEAAWLTCFVLRSSCTSGRMSRSKVSHKGGVQWMSGGMHVPTTPLMLCFSSSAVITHDMHDMNLRLWRTVQGAAALPANPWHKVRESPRHAGAMWDSTVYFYCRCVSPSCLTDSFVTFMTWDLFMDLRKGGRLFKIKADSFLWISPTSTHENKHD